ncbi:CHRD domain-containing protein [Ochrobactrum sp. AN78]|uniref:CHRD domain-containing protein n=1 Tax=Ochrobactrum sp. AN78 TaxID=3039853 RepID=UPI002989B0FB|nr:CHRD domain-containing protein [Ochrobactrum sp. AN78]MDH7790308.1 hypothetical protein [Ochrobactrum sp. AN78]
MKLVYVIVISIINIILFNNLTYSQTAPTVTCSTKGTKNNLFYIVYLRTTDKPAEPETLLFINGFSRASIIVTPDENTKPPAFARIDGDLPNDSHIQRAFEKSPRQSGIQKTVLFDIYFPMLRGMNNLSISLYPSGTDPKNITENTPGVRCNIPLNATLEASALLLNQDNKERNVRVFQVANAVPGNAEGNKSVEYFWTGRDLKNPSTIIRNAIAHVTEEHDTFLIKSLMFRQRDSSTSAFTDLPIFIDPSNSDKAHLYFLTDDTGIARLDVFPKFTPAGGHLIYWPFADNTSEAARIVVYDPTMLANDLFEPIPTKNPVTVSADKACDIPTFNIRNDDAKITENGRVYLLINENYDNSIFSSSKKTITMNSSNKFIETSNKDLPQSNTARYIYVAEDGNVNISRKYSFFAYEGRADTITTQDNTVVSFCEVNANMVTSFDVQLLGSKEVPPVATQPNASGRIIAKYNAADRLFEWYVTYAGLSGPLTAAHFHGPASVSSTAGVVIPIASDALNSAISGRQTLTKQQAQQLLAGQWYFNAHTAVNKDGEIRGQLVAN